MNSAYGKTCQKIAETKNVVVDAKIYDRFVFKNHNRIKQINRMSTNKYYIELYNTILLEQYQPCHVASEILDVSKRIMYEVMQTAQDNDIKIYYQDTDSMHIEHQDVERLQKLYDKKFGRSLIGKSMGQFHSDFAHKQAGQIDREHQGHYEPVSNKCVILGKKCYLDVVTILDKRTGAEA